MTIKSKCEMRVKERKRKMQKRLKGRVGRHGLTVTAQLMPGHEMAQPLIMTERALERQRGEREAIVVISTGC